MRDQIERLRRGLYVVIFRADTPAGRGFDIGLIAFILCSVTAIIVDSVTSIAPGLRQWLAYAEWFFTAAFTVEYALRIFCVHKPFAYIFSFYGIIDLLSILPSYISLLVPGTHYLQVIRIIRVLRVFRIFKLIRYIKQSEMLLNAIVASRMKITIFLFTISTLLVVFGSIMYLVEGPENGFTNIPVSIYWAVVTLTTVGFGDITPKTDFGRALSGVVMIIGYAIIAVPTGIFTAELSNEMKRQNRRPDGRTCPRCRRQGHAQEANYCLVCGTELPPAPTNGERDAAK